MPPWRTRRLRKGGVGVRGSGDGAGELLIRSRCQSLCLSLEWTLDIDADSEGGRPGTHLMIVRVHGSRSGRMSVRDIKDTDWSRRRREGVAVSEVVVTGATIGRTIPIVTRQT